MTTLQALNNMFNQKMNKKIQPLDLGRGLLHFIAQDSVNKYDRFAGVQGLQKGVESKVNELFTRSDFNGKIKRLGYELSKGEFDWALVTFLINGEAYIDYAMVAQSKTVAGRLVELAIHTQETFKHNDENYPVYTYWRISDGIVYKGKKIVLTTGEFGVEDEITYPGKYIPAALVYNNPMHKADVPQELKPMIMGLDYFGDDLQIEWSKVRTQFTNNMLFGSKDGKTFSKEQQGGIDVHDVNDPDGKLQQAVALLTSGSASGVNLISHIAFLEDKILKYSYTMRESTVTGAQKGTQEISGMNQAQYEYMISKMEFRTQQIYKFLNTMFRFLVEAKIINNQPRNFTTGFIMSDIEKFKMDNMSSTIALKVGQANQFNGTAANQNAQAQLNLAKVGSPEAPVKEEE